MKRKLIGLGVIVGILLVGVIAYHRFEVKTKSLFYGVFPVFAWTAMWINPLYLITSVTETQPD